MTGDDTFVAQVREEPEAADLTERERVIVSFAEKMTRTPGALGPADLDGLRRLGLPEEGVLQVTAIVGFFNYVNRMADALGVGRGEGTAG